ncbi:MAG: hypothetical protein AAB590_02800 [Patescibacteria group bacterium]
MKLWWIIFGCGLIAFFLPILGFPQAFDNTIYILTGLLLMALTLREIRKGYVRELYEQDKNRDQNTAS